MGAGGRFDIFLDSEGGISHSGEISIAMPILYSKVIKKYHMNESRETSHLSELANSGGLAHPI